MTDEIIQLKKVRADHLSRLTAHDSNLEMHLDVFRG